MLWLRNVKNSKIVAPISQNSVMLIGAQDSEFHFASQQIRLHKSYDCKFTVYTTSQLIIEDCDRVKFAEWRVFEKGEDQEQSKDLVEAMHRCGFKEDGKNFWAEVQDFNWIKQEKSPHFELVNE